MTQENQHIDTQVAELLSSIEAHAKNVRRKAALTELVDNLAAADAQASKRRPHWLYWTGMTAAACLAIVWVICQRNTTQMAINTTKPTKVIMHKDGNTTQAVPESLNATTALSASEKSLAEGVSSMGNIQVDSSQAKATQTRDMSEEEYAYSETENGIRVYCENHCNAEEVIAHMEEVVKQSIVML